MAEIELICVPPEKFGTVWPHAGHMLLRGFAAAKDVPVLASMDRCRNGTVQFWLVVRNRTELLGAFLTQIVSYQDDGKWVSLFALAGKDMRAWTRLLEERMDAFARAEGAKGTRFCGRKAWGRLITRCAAVGERAPGVVAFQRAA